MAERVTEIYPLSPLDNVLHKIGLPRTEPLATALSPRRILGDKLGLKPPGDLLEGMLIDVESRTPLRRPF